MTNDEKIEVERVCGKNHLASDIPTFIRNRDHETLVDEAARKEMEVGFDSIGMAIEDDEEEDEWRQL